MLKRLILLGAAAMLAVAVLPGAAGATPADGDGHKVTICHVTNSASNPYVVITVDVAAFDGEGKKDHTQHYSDKTGLSDAEIDINGLCPDDDDYTPPGDGGLIGGVTTTTTTTTEAPVGDVPDGGVYDG
jgi:hypothetical protein